MKFRNRTFSFVGGLALGGVLFAPLTSVHAQAPAAPPADPVAGTTDPAAPTTATQAPTDVQGNLQKMKEALIGNAVSLSNLDYAEIDKAIQRFGNNDGEGALVLAPGVIGRCIHHLDGEMRRGLLDGNGQRQADIAAAGDEDVEHLGFGHGGLHGA